MTCKPELLTAPPNIRRLGFARHFVDERLL
jgi:hypothetical protein